ncbi:unnamed protein product [Linum trigynum]|uniref:Proline-rich protein n=1 Tax=Linum trigynum TaxID=586398 RepID=A0AAV2FDN9_9ROSI
MALLRFLLVLVAALVATTLTTNIAPAKAEVVEEDHFFKKYLHKPGFDYPKPHPGHPLFNKLHKPQPFFKKPHPFFKKPSPFLHAPPIIKPSPEKEVKPAYPFHKKLFPKYKFGFGHYHPGNPPADKP